MILRTLPCLIALAGVFPTPASAEATLSLPLPMGAETSVIRMQYRCGEAAFAVQYVNSGVNSLAILPVEGTERIFVNVISGSGARYVSGRYEWWSKGAEATLTDAMSEGGPHSCTAQQ